MQMSSGRFFRHAGAEEVEVQRERERERERFLDSLTQQTSSTLDGERVFQPPPYTTFKAPQFVLLMSTPRIAVPVALLVSAVARDSVESYAL